MESVRVAFLGPNASFSHQAALESFGSSAELLPQLSFADAFAAVQRQEVDYAIIPVENSTNGSVVQTLDLLADREDRYHDVKVCGEYYLTVHHCLLVRKGAFPPSSARRDDKDDDDDDVDYRSITKLYTHPQAWGQCERFLSRHFKGVERQDVSSTSKAAEIVSREAFSSSSEEEGVSAAIASRFAARFHDVDVLKEHIEDERDNTTRFLILRNVQSARTNTALSSSSSSSSSALGYHFERSSERTEAKAQSDTGTAAHSAAAAAASARAVKTLFSFMVKHDQPGALAEALLIFKAQGLNLTSINTRPSLKRPWQYIFFVECHRNSAAPDFDEHAVSHVLLKLRDVTDGCKDLGSWRDQLG